MPYPETTTGFAVTDTKNWSTFTKQELPLKKFTDNDVDIKISACGVCGSDIHTITAGWGEVPLPLCVGHEIVGKAIRVGPKVKNIKVGDRVGVGAQAWSCLECDLCKTDQENYCARMVDTYGAPYEEAEGGNIAHGGYSSHIRANQYFVFKIPDELEDSVVAPMLCAGITTYSPLVRLGCGPGKKVAVVGMGGLGHFAVQFAVALGADVTVLSHSPSKRDDAFKLGAQHFVSTGDKDWAKPLKYKFDLILSAANDMEKFNLAEYFSTLKIGGHYHSVGLPEKPIQLKIQDMMPNGAYIGTSHIGNRPEMEAMLALAAKKDIKAWVETVNISEAGCKEVVERMKEGKGIKYRLTLVGYEDAFGK